MPGEHGERRLSMFEKRARDVGGAVAQGNEASHFQRAGARGKRCLIPASGYYEWHDARGGKQPYYFARPDDQPDQFAGLWSSWNDREAGNKLLSYTMVIRECRAAKDAAALMKPADEHAAEVAGAEARE